MGFWNKNYLIYAIPITCNTNSLFVCPLRAPSHSWLIHNIDIQLYIYIYIAFIFIFWSMKLIKISHFLVKIMFKLPTWCLTRMQRSKGRGSYSRWGVWSDWWWCFSLWWPLRWWGRWPNQTNRCFDILYLLHFTIINIQPWRNK